MSLAIKFGDTSNPAVLSGAIYFDAVTQYGKDFSGRVTEHPLEAGASITDHYIQSNPKYTISGVISSVDFSNIPSQVKIDNDSVLNNNKEPLPVSVEDSSGLRKFLPGVLDQFFGQVKPTVRLDDSERMNHKEGIENFFNLLMRGLSYNEKRKKWENRMTTATLYEMQGFTPVRPVNNLVCTSVRAEEDEETGDALILNLTFEQVTFVTLEVAEAPKPQPNTPTGRGASGKTQMGNKPGTVDDVKNPPNDRTTVLGELGQVR